MSFVVTNTYGESYTDTDMASVMGKSVAAWSRHRIKDTAALVENVRIYFSSLEKGSYSLALEALCYPLCLVRVNEQLRFVADARGSYHLLPSYNKDLLVHDEDNPGYREEDVLCHFIRQTYLQSGWTDLVRDIDLAYRCMIALGKFSHGLMFLHYRVAKSCVLPPFLHSVISLPLLPGMVQLVLNMARAVCKASFAQQLRMMVYQLTKQLVVEREEEWKMLLDCKRYSGTSWQQFKYDREITVKHGHFSWTMENNITFVLYDGRKYRERWEHRILWVAVWFHGIWTRKFSLSQSPKMLLLRLAALLSS